MTYRNDLDAARARITALENALSQVRGKNRQLEAAARQREVDVLPPAELKTVTKASRSPIRYQVPETMWPLLDDWSEMKSFFTTPDSDSVLEWMFAKIFGRLAVYAFFTPVLVVHSVALLPFVALSGFRIGPAT